VRLYLSSLRLGYHPERLVALVPPGAATAVIANACDYHEAADRQARVEWELSALDALGLKTRELDLRAFFGRPEGLREELHGVDLVWIRGGNTFLLRHALAESGADTLLGELLRVDGIAYGGYSAAACVLGPTLRGLEVADDPDAVTRTYGVAPRWDGLGLVPFAVAPHYRSPGHPQTEAAEHLAAYYEAQGLLHHRLRDGQAIVIDGKTTQVV
jgi:dipeptidase E